MAKRTGTKMDKMRLAGGKYRFMRGFLMVRWKGKPTAASETLRA
jgi:hypothetical protein